MIWKKFKLRIGLDRNRQNFYLKQYFLDWLGHPPIHPPNWSTNILDLIFLHHFKT
jgi:hypothetical protein